MDEEIRINDQFSYNPNKRILEAALDCEVYEGTFTRKVLEVQTEIKCAVKVIGLESLKTDMRFQISRELQALLCQEQSHTNIIRFYDAPEVDQTVYLIMERFDCSLDQVFGKQKENERPILDPPCQLTKKEIMKQTTEGVAFLHSLGILHRNLNPTNIVIARYWNRNGSVDKDAIKITDFMLSKRMRDGKDEASLSGRNVEMDWAAPEILLQSATITPSVDIFSLGCVFYFVLEGRHPFGNTTNLISAQALNKPITLATDFLIKSMIDFIPENRTTIYQILKDPFLQQAKFYTLYDGENIPGLCIIINQMRFKNQVNNRVGSDEDRNNLSQMFSSFGYDVEIHENLEKSDFESTIEEYSQRSYVRYLSIVVCILSHGEEEVVYKTDDVYTREVVYTADEDKIEIEKIKNAFYSEKCPSLDGKPKIFVIQACRGKVEQKKPPSGSPAADTVQERRVTRPTSDVLDIRATVPGFASYRGASGSLLISYLVHVLTHNESDLIPAYTEVNAMVAGYRGGRQVPEEITSLRKNIRFRTGYRIGKIDFMPQ